MEAIVILKQVIYTNKKKDGTDLIQKSTGAPFFMLHVETEDGTWYSRFYQTADQDPSTRIPIGEEVKIEFTQSGIYFNIVSMHHKEEKII